MKGEASVLRSKKGARDKRASIALLKQGCSRGPETKESYIAFAHAGAARVECVWSGLWVKAGEG